MFIWQRLLNLGVSAYIMLIKSLTNKQTDKHADEERKTYTHINLKDTKYKHFIAYIRN